MAGLMPSWDYLPLGRPTVRCSSEFDVGNPLGRVSWSRVNSVEMICFYVCGLLIFRYVALGKQHICHILAGRSWLYLVECQCHLKMCFKLLCTVPLYWWCNRFFSRGFMSCRIAEVRFQHFVFLLGTWGRDTYFLHTNRWYTTNYNQCFNNWFRLLSTTYLENSDLNHSKNCCILKSHHFVFVSRPESSNRSFLGWNLTPKRRDEGNMYWNQPLKCAADSCRRVTRSRGPGRDFEVKRKRLKSTSLGLQWVLTPSYGIWYICLQLADFMVNVGGYTLHTIHGSYGYRVEENDYHCPQVLVLVG